MYVPSVPLAWAALISATLNCSCMTHLSRSVLRHRTCYQFQQQHGDWAGRLGFEYRVSDDTLTYFNYGRGVKSGQYTDGPEAVLVGLFNPTAPEYVDAFEIGVKNQSLDGRLTTNLAFFHNTYEDLQAQYVGVISGVGFISTFFNVGESEVYGFELDANYYTDNGLYFNAAIGYQKSEVTAESLTNLTGGLASVEIGRNLANAPEWTGNVTVGRVFEESGVTIEPSISARYVASTQYDIADAAATRFFGRLTLAICCWDSTSSRRLWPEKPI